MGKLGDNYYVVRHRDRWAVRREGADRVSSEHDTQAAASDAVATLRSDSTASFAFRDATVASVMATATAAIPVLPATGSN
jgi:hypothetical protein